MLVISKPGQKDAEWSLGIWGLHAGCGVPGGKPGPIFSPFPWEEPSLNTTVLVFCSAKTRSAFPVLGQTQIAPQSCSYLAAIGFFQGEKINAGPDPKLESSVRCLLDERGALGSRFPSSFLPLCVKDLWQEEGSRQYFDPGGCALSVLEGPQGLSRALCLQLPPQPSPLPQARSAPDLAQPDPRLPNTSRYKIFHKNSESGPGKR